MEKVVNPSRLIPVLVLFFLLFTTLTYSDEVPTAALVKLVLKMAPSAVIIANSVSLEEVENIYQALENRIDVYRARHMDRHGHHDSRKEVMR